MTPASRPRAATVPLWLTIGFVSAFALAPAAYLFATAWIDVGGWSGALRVASDPANRAAFDQSLLQGGLSAVLAVAIGYPAGLFLGRYSWRGRDAVRSLLLVPFLLPSLVVVFGLLELFGPSGVIGGPVASTRPLAEGLPAVVAANLLFNVPLVMLFTASGCEAASPALEETVASLGGGPWRGYRDVWAGPTWTGAACGGLLTFVFSALSFAPPLLLCGPRCATVEVRVWELYAGALPDPAAAGVLALFLVAGFLAPTAAYLVLARRLAPNRSAPFVRRPVPWRTPLAGALAAVAAVVLASELLLLGVVVERSVLPAAGRATGNAWVQLFSGRTSSVLGLGLGQVVVNSLVFAALAAAVALLVALATSYVGLRRPSASYPLGLVTFVPVLLSPVVLAFSLSRLWQAPLGGPANVWLLIVLSQALTGLPFALQSLTISLRAVPSSAREAAETLGASSWEAFADAELPRVAPGVEQATLFALALGLGEFTATYFLVTPSWTTVPVAVYSLEQARGLFPASEAAAALLLFLSLAVYAATVWGARRARG